MTAARFDRSARPYWDARSTHWSSIKPLSPGADDLLFYAEGAARTARGEGLRALLLGATPEIAAMRWPAATRLVALDWSEGMLRRVFPRAAAPAGSRVVRGDWRAMPFAAASFDFVAGDGCYSTFPDFDGPAQVNREVARVLRPGGELRIRCHCRPDALPAVDDLFAALFAGRIRDLNMFRWQLAMVLHGDSAHGVGLADVWRAWHERVPDARAAQARLGWDAAALATMEAWKETRSRYLFPTLTQLRDLQDGELRLAGAEVPRYEWGEHFARLTLVRAS